MIFNKIQENTYSVKKNNLDVNIIASEKIFSNIDKTAIDQLLSIADMKNVYKKVIGLPDMHVGYGVPIGSCFASDYDTGIISSDAVGYDINCGVRLIKTNLFKKDLRSKDLQKITKSLESLPLGLSNKGISLSKKDFQEILLTGVDWAVDNDYIKKSSKRNIEDKGVYKQASLDFLSKQSIKRGLQQIGTLGQGNHFVDLLLVSERFSEKQAKRLGLFKDQFCVMLHSGSRGFGHQVAKDYSNILTYKKPFAYDLFHSPKGQAYYKSMLCASNFAFVNRTILDYEIQKKITQSLFHINKDVSFDLLYDLCHNIAKIEKYSSKKLIVHRKGATRVYTKENNNNGCPILLPGSMLHKTHVLLPGDKKKLKTTFNTVAHGSGRRMSRTKAKEKTTIEKLQQKMTRNQIILSGRSQTTMREEQPNAYKDSSEVVDSLVNSNLLKKVVSLKPKVVITG